jgi:hypothetical protein
MKRNLSRARQIAAVAAGSLLVPAIIGPVHAAVSPILATRLPVNLVAQATTTEMDPALVQVNTRPAIPFHPFTMRDPRTGRIVDPDTLITLHNGKRMTAGDYYAEANSLERGFNALGYSLRSSAPVTLQESRVNVGALQSQASGIAAMHKPFDQQTMAAIPSFQQLEAQHQLLVNQDALRFQRLNQAIATKSLVRSGAPAAGSFPGSFSQPNTWNYEIGDPDTLYAFVNGRQDLTGNLSQATLSADAKAGGAIFGHNFDLLRATGSLSSPKSGALSANLKLNVIGFGDIYNFNQSANASWTKSDSFSKPVDVHTTLHMFIGPVPVGVTIGARGSANLQYWVGLRPGSVSANVQPSLQADVYGEAGVDIGIASAGFGGSVTLIRGGVVLTGTCSLDVDAKGPYVDLDYGCFDIIQALSGRVYAYADVDVLLYSKRWEHDFWSWDGVSTSGYLFNGNARHYL